MPKPHDDHTRAGRVRELTKSSRSKFKIVWHQFSTVLVTGLSGKFVQFRLGHGDQRLRSVQFSSGSVRSIEPLLVLGGERNSSRSPPAEIPARRPGVCRLGGGMVSFAGCACCAAVDMVWCQSDANSVQNRQQKVRSVQFT